MAVSTQRKCHDRKQAGYRRPLIEELRGRSTGLDSSGLGTDALHKADRLSRERALRRQHRERPVAARQRGRRPARRHRAWQPAHLCRERGDLSTRTDGAFTSAVICEEASVGIR